MAALKDILPLLYRARASLEAGYAALLEVAAHEGIPCEAVSVYTGLRRELVAAEDRIVKAARLAGLHPPEDVPRALALLGACAPGQAEVRLDGETRALGKNHVDAVQQRAQLSDLALRAAYAANAEFAAHARAMVEWLAPLAQAGTAEAAPAPPQNLVLLRLLYYLGGTIWPVMEAERLWPMDLDVVSVESASTLFRQAAVFERAAAALAEEAAPPPPLLSGRGWFGVALGFTAAATGLGALSWYLSRPHGASEEPRPDDGQPWADLPSGRAASQRALPAHEGGR